jgi:hypothetical protein
MQVVVSYKPELDEKQGLPCAQAIELSLRRNPADIHLLGRAVLPEPSSPLYHVVNNLGDSIVGES